uniref:C2H2-type domain-containing protein n=1 Tax=Stegastes partitus TaxID=144197 RepID=A0A3B5BFE4_9TELE
MKQYIQDFHEKGKVERINVKDAIYFIRDAWKDVKQSTIANCWRHAGILPGCTNHPCEQSDSVEVENEVACLIREFKSEDPVTAEEYLAWDNAEPTEAMLTTADILSLVSNTENRGDSDSESEGEEDPPKPVTLRQHCFQMLIFLSFLLVLFEKRRQLLNTTLTKTKTPAWIHIKSRLSIMCVSVLPGDIQQLLVIKEEDPDEEGEQLNGQDEADISRFSFTAVPVKSEDDEEKPQFSQLHQSQTEENKEAKSSSAEQMKTETDGEDCGRPEPTENPHSTSNLQPNTDGKSSDSCESDVINGDDGGGDDCDKEELQDDEWQEPLSDSGSETEHSDSDWKETGAPASGVNSNVGCNADKKLFSCSECDKQFLHKRSLQRHMTCHSGRKSSSCSANEKTCRMKQNAESQMKVQKGDRPFSCDVCGKSFTRQCNLNRHKKVHTGEKPFGCDVCSKRFSRPEELKTHTRVHTGEKPFGCDVCGKRFNQKIHIKRHKRVHTGEKPFSCDVCSKRFSRPEDLKTHMRLHTGEKPFKCNLCGKGFNQKIHIKKHMTIHSAHHNELQMYIITDLSFSF